MRRSGPGVLIGGIIFGLIIITGYRFYEYALQRNFLLQANVTCDAQHNSCFVADCSADTLGCDTTAYEKITILARNAPSCIEEHSCKEFNCASYGTCSVQYCAANAVQTGEKCITTQTP